MTTRQANLLKSSRRCLKCGKPIWTDRCHRLCVACANRNEGLVDDRGSVAHELRPWVRTLVYSESFQDSAASFGLSAALTEA
ncbi:MAG: hypothetical protein FJ291_18445 [Planctomycetes bacterium]|nr:hypothetical protein [Planctomycetota bacterium]